MYKLDEPTAGQNPTYWAVRDTKDKDHPSRSIAWPLREARARGVAGRGGAEAGARGAQRRR